jgi:hypothetical protein
MKVIKTITVDFSAKEKDAALKSLAKVRGLFGKNGKNWMKGEENGLHPETGEETYCLIGALKEVDGTGQVLAAVAVLAAINGQKSLERVVLGRIEEDDINTDLTNGDDIERLLGEKALDSIPDFNDDRARGYEDISRVLTKAEKMLK